LEDTIVRLVLATDMKQHFIHIKTLKTVVEQQKKADKAEKDNMEKAEKVGLFKHSFGIVGIMGTH